MKAISLLLLLFVWALTPLAAQPMTDAERQTLVTYLTETGKALRAEVKDLTLQQLTYKPSAESWSVIECVEHLAITEPMLMGMIKDKILKAPANPEAKPKEMMTAEQIMNMISSRERKVKTGESMAPGGKFGDAKATVNAFKNARKETMSYVKKTTESVHDHFQQSPIGQQMDAYLWMVFVAAHSRRHTEQIKEIKASASFPKKGS